MKSWAQGSLFTDPWESASTPTEQGALLGVIVGLEKQANEMW